MLTKEDLNSIKKVVRETVRDEIEAEVKNAKEEIVYDIANLKLRMQGEFGEVKDRLKNLDTTINFFDREVLGLRKKVEVLESKSNLQ